MSANAMTATITCRCGEVRIETKGAPIVTATCHCESCQKAAAGFAEFPGKPQVLNAEHGTGFTLYRKDRVQFVRGEALLRAYRLTSKATTRRVLARCCDTPMFLEFFKGHWLSIYRARFGAAGPAIEMRVLTSARPKGVTLSGDVPTYEKHSVKFMWRLFAAWAAMGFRVPEMKPIEAAVMAGE
jgi:hypothetical protein